MNSDCTGWQLCYVCSLPVYCVFASMFITYCLLFSCLLFICLLQCCIDLHKNVLRVGTSGTEVHFLSEGELPKHARLARLSSSDGHYDEDRQLAQAIAQSEKEFTN